MDLLHTKNKKKGFSMVELLIAMVIFTIFSTGVLYLSLDTLQRNGKMEVNNEALLYAQEGLEATRNIRDRDFLELVSGEYGLDFTDDTWSFTVAPENIDEYYLRTITIEDVYRDVNGNIAETGTLDQEIKKITSEVGWTWRSILPMSTSLTTYLTGWRSDEWLQTTCTEFNEGTYDGTSSIATPAPPEDNCAMQLKLVEQVTENFASSNIGNHGEDVVTDGNYAFVATYSNSKGLTVVDISDPVNPSVVNGINITGKGRYVAKQGNYIYEGVTNSDNGLAVIDISDPENPDLLANYDLDGYGNQPAPYGNYLFMAVDSWLNSFQVIDISNPSNPNYITGLDFYSVTNVIHIEGNYAYVGTDNWFYNNFKVIDISNPEAPAEVAGLVLNDEVSAIEIDGVFAYVGTEDSNSSLKVINISNPENPTVLASLDVGGKIRDIVIDDEYLYVSVNQNDQGLVIVNISNPLIPYISSKIDLTGKGNGLYTDGEYIYMGLDVNNKGLVINRALVSSYLTNGTYTSSVLDTESTTTRYDFIEWEASSVPGGSAKFQLRTASSEAELSSATWVGSDGTNATYYESSRTAITLSSDRTGVRYFQFKIFATSDSVQTPNIESVTIKYTP